MLLGMVMTLLFMPLNVFSVNFALPESTAFPYLSFPFGELPDTIPLGDDPVTLPAAVEEVEFNVNGDTVRFNSVDTVRIVDSSNMKLFEIGRAHV